MKNSPSPPKPNQLKEKFVVIGRDGETSVAFGTPSGRAFHGPEAAHQAAEILDRLYPNMVFTVMEVVSYLASPTEVGYNEPLHKE